MGGERHGVSPVTGSGSTFEVTFTEATEAAITITAHDAVGTPIASETLQVSAHPKEQIPNPVHHPLQPA